MIATHAITAPGRRRRGAHRAAAFTLIEVLATLALIGIVIPVSMRGVTQALQAASHAKHQAAGATLAESKLSELIAQGDWSFGAGSGDFGQDWPGYQWSCTTANPDPNVNVTEVTVTVTWTERGQQRDVSMATFVYAGSANGGGTTGGL